MSDTEEISSGELPKAPEQVSTDYQKLFDDAQAEPGDTIAPANESTGNMGEKDVSQLDQDTIESLGHALNLIEVAVHLITEVQSGEQGFINGIGEHLDGIRAMIFRLPEGSLQQSASDYLRQAEQRFSGLQQQEQQRREEASRQVERIPEDMKKIVEALGQGTIGTHEVEMTLQNFGGAFERLNNLAHNDETTRSELRAGMARTLDDLAENMRALQHATPTEDEANIVRPIAVNAQSGSEEVHARLSGFNRAAEEKNQEIGSRSRQMRALFEQIMQHYA